MSKSILPIFQLVSRELTESVCLVSKSGSVKRDAQEKKRNVSCVHRENYGLKDELTLKGNLSRGFPFSQPEDGPSNMSSQTRPSVSTRILNLPPTHIQPLVLLPPTRAITFLRCRTAVSTQTTTSAPPPPPQKDQIRSHSHSYRF